MVFSLRIISVGIKSFAATLLYLDVKYMTVDEYLILVVLVSGNIKCF